MKAELMTQLVIRIDLSNSRYEPTEHRSTKDLVAQAIAELMGQDGGYDAVASADCVVASMDGISIELSACCFVLVTGNPFDGLNMIGPFADPEVANGYADANHADRTFWCLNLQSPIPCEH